MPIEKEEERGVCGARRGAGWEGQGKVKISENQAEKEMNRNTLGPYTGDKGCVVSLPLLVSSIGVA